MAGQQLRTPPHVLARESCSDLVNSVYRECLQELDRFEFRHEEGFRKWAFQKARSKLADRVRHWQAAARDPAREAPVSVAEHRARELAASEFAMRSEHLAALEAALADLSPDHRRVIEEVEFRGLPQRDVAAAMGRDEGALRMLLLRARARLGVLMRERLGSQE